VGDEAVEVEEPAVPRRDRRDPRPLGDAERDPLRPGADDLHAEVGEHREPRTDRADEPLRVVCAEVEVAAVATPGPRRVHHEEIHAGVRVGERVEPEGVHHVGGDEPRRGEPVAVRLDAVVVGERGLEHDLGGEVVARTGREQGTARDEGL
jgi:hypothetical protein